MPQEATHDRLSGEDLSFWRFNSPLQSTTMGMLMVLDRPPQERQLRRAFERTVAAVPRLAQRVADAPFDLTVPHWENDPTFDLDFHLRRHALTGACDLDELFREITPAYETPFDRSRPLWEARVYDGIAGHGQSALFFKLHHAVADGVGGNAIFAAMTDCERTPPECTPMMAGTDCSAKHPWPAPRSFGARLIDAVVDRIDLDRERLGSVASAVVDTARHPEKLRRGFQAVRSLIEVASFDSHSPLKKSPSRARRMCGLQLPFAEVRRVKHALGGTMIDVILTVMTVAMGKWHRVHHIAGVRELMTLVPVNLRTPEQWAQQPQVGNAATGILVPLPIRLTSPMATYREVRRRVQAKKNDPAIAASPVMAELLSLLPRALFTWMAESTLGNIDFIVTNVPGIPVPRYLAGSEIVAAYPFAPVATKSPVSVALYGYREQLFIGLEADEVLMPDVDAFKAMVEVAFQELRAAAGVNA